MSRYTRTLTTVGALSLAALPLVGLAADHSDSPAVMSDPTADITDVYAWMNQDKLALVLDVPSAAMFSDAVQYVFHIDSGPAYGMADAQTMILCRFDASQRIECWLGEDDDYAIGDASDEAGLMSYNGTFRVFAGLRDDPFFFNATGFSETIATVVSAAGGLTFDEAGCPALDMATSGALVTQLMSEPGGDPAMDDFTGDVLSIVIEVDASAVTAGGPVVGVWASTHR